jgi:hypothetical protein
MRKCFFDPRKACGSYSRSKLAYQRGALVELAGSCGIPTPEKFSMDALCTLLRDSHFQDRLTSKVLDALREMPFSFANQPLTSHQQLQLLQYIPAPSDMPQTLGAGAGNVSIASASAILTDTKSLDNIKKISQNLLRRIVSGEQIEEKLARRVELAVRIFLGKNLRKDFQHDDIQDFARAYRAQLTAYKQITEK